MAKLSLTRIMAFAFMALFLLSSCGAQTGTVAQTEGATTTQTASVTESQTVTQTEESDGKIRDEKGRVVKFDPPVDVSWAVSTAQVQQFKEGDTYENNLWSRRYLDELGINLKVAFTADGYTSAYREKLNAQLAAGDLPDVIYAYNYQFYKQAYEAGYLTDITDIYEKNASDYMLDIRDRYPDTVTYTSFDNKLYGISNPNDNRCGGILLWIRDDWLENLNMEAPKTLDEFYKLAEAFTFDDPDGNGLDDTFGIALNKDLLSDYGSLLGFLHAFGVPVISENDGTYYRGADGKITNSFLEPGLEDALALVHRMYVDGLIDPEFTVKDLTSIQEDTASGKIGMGFGRQWGTWLPWNLLLQAEDVIARPYATPAAEGYELKIGIPNNAGGAIYCVNAKCAYPEAMVMMFNVYSSVMNIDTTPEVSAIWIDDEQKRFSPVDITEPQEPVWGPIILEALKSGSGDDLPARLKNHYNRVFDFEGGERSSEAYGLWGQYRIGGSVDICMNVYAKNGNLIQDMIGATKPDSQNDYASLLVDLEKQMLTEIILTGDMSKVEQFRQAWLDAGGQQILDELESLYPAP